MEAPPAEFGAREGRLFGLLETETSSSLSRMKGIVTAVIAIVTAATLFASDRVPVLKGVLSTGGQNRFVLADASGRTSDFIGAGESFDGFKIVAYDSSSGTLQLERAGQKHHAPLVRESATPTAKVDQSQILQALGGIVRVSGILMKDGKVNRVAIDGKVIPVGTKFSARYNGQEYWVEIVTADRQTYTLRLNGEERTFRI